MMKFALLLCVMVAAVIADDKYTDKYDSVDIGEILGNQRLVDGHAKCLLDEGKCSPEGKELKDHVKDAIETGCKKCTEAQEAGVYKVIEHLIKNELGIWRKLCAKYDPTGTWRKKYEERAKANGIEIPE